MTIAQTECTATVAVIPPINGLRDDQTRDTRDATSAQEAPGRLVVPGGGAAEEEMAPAWHRPGGFEPPSWRPRSVC